MDRHVAGRSGPIVLLLLLTGSLPAGGALQLVIDARPTDPPPASPRDKLSAELRATVRLRGKFEGLTHSGKTIVLLPDSFVAAAGASRLAHLPHVVVRVVGTTPDPPIDSIRELIVFFGPGSLPGIATTAARMQVVDRYPRGNFVVLRADRAIGAGQLQELEADSTVTFVQPNYRYRLAADPPPDDPDYLTDTLIGLAQIHAFDAWRAVHDSPVRVAVLDTGIEYTHEDLVQNVWTNENEKETTTGTPLDDDDNGCVDDLHGCDFLDDDGNPEDFNGHGTRVAGIIAAQGNNAKGGVGVAWKLTLIPVRIINSNSTYGTSNAIAKAIDYAMDNGAQVMNASWYGTAWQDVAVSDAITRAAGSLLVAAAGGFERGPGCESSVSILLHTRQRDRRDGGRKQRRPSRVPRASVRSPSISARRDESVKSTTLRNGYASASGPRSPPPT